MEDVIMKKWNSPMVVELDLADTAHDWWPQPSLDGGYIGDGQISGWFGQPDNNGGNNNGGNNNGGNNGGDVVDPITVNS